MYWILYLFVCDFLSIFIYLLICKMQYILLQKWRDIYIIFRTNKNILILIFIKYSIISECNQAFCHISFAVKFDLYFWYIQQISHHTPRMIQRNLHANEFVHLKLYAWILCTWGSTGELVSLKTAALPPTGPENEIISESFNRLLRAESNRRKDYLAFESQLYFTACSKIQMFYSSFVQ